MTFKEAYEKLDNTLCLNLNEGNLHFQIDEYDNPPCDCRDEDDMIDCLETIFDYKRLFEAMENGFYGIDSGAIIHYYCEHYVPHLQELHTSGVLTNKHKSFKVGDYGKTWALTKEELEEADE